MKVDYGNRNCYNCRRFGYLVRNYRNRVTGDKIGEDKKLVLQTSFSLYLYNQWTDFYKLSCTGKP